MKKKLSALFTAGIMLMSGLPALSEGEEETALAQEISDAEPYAVLSGENFSDFQSYEVTLTADNTNGEEYNGEIILASCDDATNQTYNVSRFPVTVPKGERFTKTVATEYIEGMEHIRAFFWDNTENMRPLAQSIDSRYFVPEAAEIPLTEENVWASDRQDQHGIAQALDENTSTYLAGEAKEDSPLLINIILSRVYDLSELKIGFHSADGKRSYSFQVEGSLDGELYTPMTETLNSDETSDLPMSVALSQSAKYVRVKVFGYNGNNSGWIRVNSLSLYGAPCAEVRRRFMNDSFYAGFNVNSADTDNGWFAYALNEETYTDYTPSMGSGLFAKRGIAPEAMGQGDNNGVLYIKDDVDRSGSSETGAGALGVFRKLTLPDDNKDYTVKFKLFIPDDGKNINWAGISLLSDAVSGGADLSPAAAIQLRFENGADGGVKIRSLKSVQFNEGELLSCFEKEFTRGRPWDIEIEVSPEGKRAQITVCDGETKETRTVGYNYTDIERVNNQTWENTKVNYICINTGAGGKCELYADDFTLSADEIEGQSAEKIVFSQNFEAADSLESAGVEQAVVLINDDGTTNGASISDGLKATVAQSGTFGSKVLKLTDTNASDGLVAAIPLTLPDNNNKYIVKWKMRDFDAGKDKNVNYSGFSLGYGFNRGKTDTEHPLALQLRYSKQNDGMQFNRYEAALFNGGSYNAFLGTGSGNRLATDKTWQFSVTVNPVTKTMEIYATDGSKELTASAAFSTSDGGDSTVEDWEDKRPDTLLFHTGGGASSDCIIDDIQVIDTGVEEISSMSAAQGIVRLESAWGKGKYLTDVDGSLRSIAGIDPDDTRFAERPGLADKKGVSLESVQRPGYFLTAHETDDVNHKFVLELLPYENTAQFKAQATFFKLAAVNSGSYSGVTVNYVPVWDTSRKICYINTSDYEIAVSSVGATYNDLFYLRKETSNYVSDNFKGTGLNSQWHNNYPWKSANQTNDSYNYTALIDYRNIEVSDGRLLLKATKISDSDWPTNLDGDTGINYNGKYSKNWYKWAGRVGVISSKKVFKRQSLVSGRFKQPESPVGYWNAFWLNAASGWPPETDIFEYMSHKGVNTWYTAIHRYDSNDNEVGYGAWQSVSGINVRTGYHNFTLDWGYDYMRFYVDGQLYCTNTNTDNLDEQNKGVQLILNTGIGGWETEPDDTTVWDTGMECQWVRSFMY